MWLQTSLEQVERRLDAARLTAAGGSGAGADQVGTAAHLQARGANGAATPPSEEQSVDGLKAAFEAQASMQSLQACRCSAAATAEHGRRCRSLPT